MSASNGYIGFGESVDQRKTTTAMHKRILRNEAFGGPSFQLFTHVLLGQHTL